MNSLNHFLLIDSFTKLSLKKDSSLMLALTLKQMGEKVLLIFEEDFYVTNLAVESGLEFVVHEFSGTFEEDSFYLKSFSLGESRKVAVRKNDWIHMRLDPPFDTRYLRYQWMLEFLQEKGVRILNSPKGVLVYNEKILAYRLSENFIPTFIGNSLDEYEGFLSRLKGQGQDSIILKPLDLYQGIGVEKIDLSQGRKFLLEKFQEKLRICQGPVVVQPFLNEIYAGEIRAVYFKGKELGSILKTPPQGQYLANIAQGASYRRVDLSEKQTVLCKRICERLEPVGVFWVAFDLIGEYVSEVNITCPGLLVEVSNAVKRNLAEEIVNEMRNLT